MALLSSYSDGTIAIDNGSAVVSGIGTAWSTQVKPGDVVFHRPAGGPQQIVGEVATVDGDLALTLRDSWQGAALADAAYRITKGLNWLSGAEPVAVLVQLLQELGGLGLAGVSAGLPAPDTGRENELRHDYVNGVLYGKRAGSWQAIATGFRFSAFGLAEDRDAHDGEPAGFTFFATDEGGFYAKLSADMADWSGLVSVKGEGQPGPPGSGINPVGEYEDHATYAKGDSVSSAITGASYVAIGPVTNVNPGVDAGWQDYWQLLAAPGEGSGDGDVTGPETATDGHMALFDGPTGKLLKAGGPPVLFTHVRERLTAARTYYVRTDGNDGNDGLSDGSNGAFATIQQALDVIASLDIASHDVIIRISPGTYSAGAHIVGAWLGSGSVSLVGDVLTPANVVISTTNADAVRVEAGGRLNVRGVRLQTATGGNCLYAYGGGRIVVDGAVEFGECANFHISAEYGGAQVDLKAGYAIAGGATCHYVPNNGTIVVNNQTINLTGSQTYWNFVYATRLGVLVATGNIYTGGTITGKRYNVDTNSVVLTNGAGANYFPGATAGTSTDGGIYK